MKLKNKFKPFIKVLTFLIVLSTITSFSSCTSKKERCDQIAMAMMKYNFIDHKTYDSGSIQNACQMEWDTKCLVSVHGACQFKDNSEWRECILDATSKAEMNPCGMLYLKGDKFR